MVDEDISTHEERLHTSSNVGSDCYEKVNPALAGDEAKVGDVVED